MKQPSRRSVVAALLLGLVAVIISLAQAVAWAQGTTSAFDLWDNLPAWIGMIAGLLGAAFGFYAAVVALRRDVNGLRTLVYGTGDEKNGLVHRMSIVEERVGTARLMTEPDCRQLRSDCRAANKDLMKAAVREVLDERERAGGR